MLTKIAMLFMLLWAAAANAQQKVIPLYNGNPPGTEGWAYNEQMTPDSNLVYNVSHPTLTVYMPDPVLSLVSVALRILNKSLRPNPLAIKEEKALSKESRFHPYYP